MTSTDIFFLCIWSMFTLVICLLGYAVHMENMHSKGCHEELVRIAYDNNSFHEQLVWRCEKKNEQ